MKRSQRMRLTFLPIVAAVSFVAYAQETAVPAEQVQDLPVLGPMPFISYFKAIPVRGELSTSAWGAKEVGPRDPANGLEDPALKRWNYWDGQILKGSDGKYRMFASRWDQALGHKAWGGSKAVLAVSPSPLGPYRDRGTCTATKSGPESGQNAEMNERPKLGSGGGGANVRVWVLA